MKNVVIFGALLAASSLCAAQGYVGAVAAFARLSESCTAGYECSGSQTKGFKLFAGARLSPSQTLNLGPARINRVEVAAMRFGRVNSNGLETIYVLNDSFDVVPQDVASKHEVSANALAVAAVAEIPVTSDLAVLARVGVAYVTATMSTTLDGTSNGSKSGNAIRPYLGLGVEYALPNDIQLVSSIDWTRYSVGTLSGSATQIGFGASVGF